MQVASRFTYNRLSPETPLSKVREYSRRRRFHKRLRCQMVHRADHAFPKGCRSPRGAVYPHPSQVLAAETLLILRQEIQAFVRAEHPERPRDRKEYACGFLTIYARACFKIHFFRDSHSSEIYGPAGAARSDASVCTACPKLIRHTRPHIIFVRWQTPYFSLMHVGRGRLQPVSSPRPVC